MAYEALFAEPVRRRPLSHLLEAAIGELLFHRARRDQRLLAELRDEIANGSGPPAPAENAWTQRRVQLRRLLLERDPWDFLRWDPIRTTMVKRGRAPVAFELRHLRRHRDWKRRWRPALREWTIGRPRPFHQYPWSSGNLIHQAYHLCRFEETTRVSLVSLPFAVEFGGGYGSLCRLFHRLGFAGTYLIFDLPELTALQRFFLRHLGIPVAKTPGDGRLPGERVVVTSDLDAFKAAVRARPPGPAAFVATWSLSEAPVALREIVLAEVDSFEAFLLGYTERFADIDNVRFFSEWRARLPDHAWYDVPIPHLRKAERYLFGVRDGMK